MTYTKRACPHFALQVIECVPTQHITNLLDTFSGNLVSLSHHPFGCRVMQRILEHCSDQARYDSFMAEILKVRTGP
jgi:pumilio RNA-binding family